MNKCTNDLALRGKRALLQILYNLRKIDVVDPKVFFKIFDSQIQPILLYGAELWGVSCIENIEKIHVLACKRYLYVGLQTPNVIIYGECGRYPLYINALCRVIKYWLKLTEMHPGRIPKKSYDMLLYLDNIGQNNYASHIRNILFSHGFGFVWLAQGVGNKVDFLRCFKDVCINMFYQSWHCTLHSSARYDLYRECKSLLVTEKYLSVIHEFKYPNVLIKFRAGLLRLKQNEGRWLNIDVSLRTCPLCKFGIEDEFHFLLVCKYYSEERLRYFPHVYNRIPNIFIFKSLLSSASRVSLLNVCKYIYTAYKKRQTLLNA
ncbi:uncharacterized protein [Haliotis asinina]|uniref:uncharacterized protein n=1 Tax=Haliotis asinina TaxID=109174 RepID=UPI0035323CB2